MLDHLYTFTPDVCGDFVYFFLFCNAVIGVLSSFAIILAEEERAGCSNGILAAVLL